MKVLNNTPELLLCTGTTDQDHQDSNQAKRSAMALHLLDGAASASSLQSTDVSTVESTFDGWDCEQRNDQLSKMAGHAALEQMEYFDSFSSLESSEDLPPELSWDDLDVGTLLGSGGFSSVYQVSILPSPKAFAVKFLNKKLWQQESEQVLVAASDLAMEASILSRLHHPNIITLHGSSGDLSTSFQYKGGFFLVLDLLADTLHESLQQWRLTKQTSLVYRLKSTAVGIASAMTYLHKRNICFRDLKPQNVGYDRLTGQVKIFDFGLATEVEMGQRLCTTVGTPRWMAPEVAMGETYGLSCDVYSFGIVLWQLCSLKRPFDKKFASVQHLFEHVAVKRQRPSLSMLRSRPPKALKKLIKECWHPDSKRRPTFKSIQRRLQEILATL